MSDIIVERHWETPLSAEDLADLQQRSAPCLDIHRVTWLSSALSADRRDLVCHFAGPDAESVRISLRQAGSLPDHSWASSVHDAAGIGDADIAAANVLVSRSFAEPVTFASIQALEDVGSGCLETHRVHFLRSYFAADRKRMICLYRAPDAESVRIAQREASMPVERIWSFRRLSPQPG